MKTAKSLSGLVIAVAGAGGPAGHAALARLGRAGATVYAADANADGLQRALEQPRAEEAVVHGDIVDLLDWGATERWAKRVAAEQGRVDGVLHLVGGWRGSKTFRDTNLADWSLLSDLLIRTVQHTSLAFHDALLNSARGRFVLVSAESAAKPTMGIAAYAAAKAAAEAWTLAMADSFRRAQEAADSAESGSRASEQAAAVIVVVKALVHQALRAQQPHATFAGFTDVADLAEFIVGLWGRPASELNGKRLVMG